MLMKLWNDDCGAIISAELALVLSIIVIGVVVGLSEIAVAVNTELNDLSNAIGALNQGYYFTGFQAGGKLGDKFKSGVSGTRWNDQLDDCDQNLSCEIVCGAPTSNTTEGVGSF
ncbi:MAG: hypothetical protein KF777_14360 [Planctomycetaceae bacterium]|nr:hypothetical protein [Planctomycetaceae bacterium]